jgi:hypothetical protein
MVSKIEVAPQSEVEGLYQGTSLDVPNDDEKIRL